MSVHISDVEEQESHRSNESGVQAVAEAVAVQEADSDRRFSSYS